MKFDPLFSIIALIIFALYSLLYIFFKTRFITSGTLQTSNLQTLPKNKTWRIWLYQFLPALRLIAIAALCIALSRPQIGTMIEKVSQSSFAITMLIDRSSSMGQKMQYDGAVFNRLDVVKKVFKEFVLGNNDDLIGRSTDLISLSSFALFLEENYPLTFEHGSLTKFAEGLQLAEKYEDGTMIGDALYQSALKLVSLEDDFKKYKNYEDDFKLETKIIILLTDGQQTRGGLAPLQAAAFLKKNNIKVYTIAIVPAKSIQQQLLSGVSNFFSGFFDQDLDTRSLEEIARITGGQFAKVTSGERLKEFYATIDQLEKTKFEEKVLRWEELFDEFLYFGLMLLLLEYALANILIKKL